jgi:hypothetical protein
LDQTVEIHDDNLDYKALKKLQQLTRLMVLNNRMVSKQCGGKDVKGSQVYGTIPELA